MKKDILNMKSVAYWSAIDGVEVKKIEYGIDDYILCVSGAWRGKKTCHRLKIYYSGRPYIKLYGYRLYLDDCLNIR